MTECSRIWLTLISELTGALSGGLAEIGVEVELGPRWGRGVAPHVGTLLTLAATGGSDINITADLTFVSCEDSFTATFGNTN